MTQLHWIEIRTQLEGSFFSTATDRAFFQEAGIFCERRQYRNESPDWHVNRGPSQHTNGGSGQGTNAGLQQYDGHGSDGYGQAAGAAGWQWVDGCQKVIVNMGGPEFCSHDHKPVQ